jgi:hypothetical protein
MSATWWFGVALMLGVGLLLVSAERAKKRRRSVAPVDPDEQLRRSMLARIGPAVHDGSTKLHVWTDEVWTRHPDHTEEHARAELVRADPNPMPSLGIFRRTW